MRINLIKKYSILAFIAISHFLTAQMEPGYAVISCIPADDDVVLAILDINQLGTVWQNSANHNTNQHSAISKIKMFKVPDFGGNWVYSIDIDTRDGAIYTASSSLFSPTSSTPTPLGSYPVTPTIYRIDPDNFSVSVVGTLPGSLGIGYISLDTIHNQIFATNMDNGIIYSMDLTTGAINDTYDYGAADISGNQAFPPMGDRVLGIDYNYAENKVYYSIWADDYGPENGNGNPVRSISINAAGDFVNATDALEFTPSLIEYGFSDPVADIEFNKDGTKVLLAELSFNSNVSSGQVSPAAHTARLLGYSGSSGSWAQMPAYPGNLQGTYDIGNYATYKGRNSRGGADWAYESIDGCSVTGNEDFVVSSGDFLKNISIYGFQFTPASGGRIDNSLLIDVDGISSQNKYTYGDIDVYIPDDNFDVELEKTVDNNIAAVDDLVTFTLTVNNESCNSVSGVQVTDLLPTGLTYQSHSPTSSSYNAATGVWNIGNMVSGETISLDIIVQVEEQGTYVNIAEVSSMNEDDIDSTPNNGDPYEDDIASACVTVPVGLNCQSESLTLIVEPGFDSYKWYKDGIEIIGETSNTYVVTELGTYTYSIVQDGCDMDGCCPIDVIDADCCCTNVFMNGYIRTYRGWEKDKP